MHQDRYDSRGGLLDSEYDSMMLWDRQSEGLYFKKRTMSEV